MALYPLHQAFGVKRIFASSYQAVSGTGAKAVEELSRQVEQIVAGEPVTREVIRIKSPSTSCRRSMFSARTATRRKKPRWKMKAAKSCIIRLFAPA